MAAGQKEIEEGYGISVVLRRTARLTLKYIPMLRQD